MNIDQAASIRILAHYWSTYKPKDINTKTVFVGDIHGDLNQLLLPLVELGIIQVNNSIRCVYESTRELCKVYIPDFIVLRSDIDVYFLGDYIDEGNHSRSCVAIIHELSKHDFIHLLIGNHDANILGRYNEYKNKTLRFQSLKSYWPTLQREATAYDAFSKGNVDDELLNDYFNPLFDWYFDLFKNRKLNVCYQLELDRRKFIVSHAIITKRSIHELVENKSRASITADDKPLIEGDITNIKKKNEFMLNYEDVNTLFLHSNASFITSNRLLYNRLETDFWSKLNIVGHTPGFEYRQIANPKPCRDKEERQSHCQPTKRGDALIYYFDILASSGYNIDNVSRPDYFYYLNTEAVKEYSKEKYAKDTAALKGVFMVSNSQALHLEYNVDKDELIFESYKGKNRSDGVFKYKNE